MSCGCIEDKNNSIKNINAIKDDIKNLSLESIKNLSIDDIISLYKQGYRLENISSTSLTDLDIITLGCYYITGISVSDKTVNIANIGNTSSWTLYLKDYNGNLEKSFNGSGTGPQSITATTYDTPSTNHKIGLTYGWGSEECDVHIPQPPPCAVSAVYFRINDTAIVGSPCTANLTDTIAARCVGTSFRSDEMEQKFKACIQIQMPDGTYVSHCTGLETVTTVTHDFTIPLTDFMLPINIPIPICPGTYSIYSAAIYDANNKTLCGGSSNGGLCSIVTLQGTAPTPTASITGCPTTITYGGSAQLTISGSGGTLPYKYDLLIDGTPSGTPWTNMTGSQSFTHTFNETAGSAHTYAVKVTDGCGQIATSPSCSVTITSCSAPVVSVQCPTSLKQGDSNNIVATIGTPAGTSPYVYKLFRDSDELPISTYPISGTTANTSHTFIHKFSETATDHIFRVDVTDSCINPQTGSDSCSVTINPATAPPPSSPLGSGVLIIAVAAAAILALSMRKKK